jgi:NitT/TauT family transport system permease protein
MLIMGVGDAPKIAVVVMGCFFVCVINSAYGVLHCSPARLFVAEVMGASKTFTFFRVRLPEAMPSISSGIRVSISYAVVLVVVSEMFVGTDVGLGRLIYDSHSSFKTAQMYATIAVAGAIGYLANQLYAMVEKRVFHWSGKTV